MIIIREETRLSDESLMQMGLDLGISIEDCYEFKVDEFGDQWQVIDKRKYADKVRKELEVEIEEEKS